LVLLFQAGMKLVCPVKRFDGLKLARGGLGEPARRTSVDATGLLVDGNSEVSGARDNMETGMRPALVGTWLDGDCERDRRDDDVERLDGDTCLLLGDGGAGE
jgi:hypothetical protein